MEVKLLYFASLREQLGRESETLLTIASTVAELRTELIGRGGAWTALADVRRIRAAVNQEVVAESTPLAAGAEVAFLPPVTGG